jgi:YHS domain-containing protein
MDVEEKKAAAKVAYQGKTYYFCAVACRETFAKAPERYVIAEKLSKGVA